MAYLINSKLCECGHPLKMHINGVVCIHKEGEEYCDCGKYKEATPMKSSDAIDVMDIICTVCGHRYGVHYSSEGIIAGDNSLFCNHKTSTGISELLCGCTGFVPPMPKTPVTDVCVCGHTYHTHTVNGLPASEGCLAMAEDGSFCSCKLFEVPAKPAKVEKNPVKVLDFADKWPDSLTAYKMIEAPKIDPLVWKQLKTILQEDSAKGSGLSKTVSGINYLVQAAASDEITLKDDPKVAQSKKEAIDNLWLKIDYAQQEKKMLMWDDDWEKNNVNPYGTPLTASGIKQTLQNYTMTLKPKEFFGYQELEMAHNFMRKVTKLSSMNVNGVQLEHLMAAYAEYRHQDMEERFEQRVQERVQAELKKKHKGDCIPTFRKRDRKFRNG